MKGNIHSIETMGLLDGPGIRVTIFMQGCPLRCSFCHNPDTWIPNTENKMTKEEILNFCLRFVPYFKNNGGVTFSGGEPLLQSDFLIECLKLLKENNIHTCLDTSGVGKNIEEVLKYTDLVLYDIKALEKDKYQDLVNYNISDSLNFLDICQKLNKKIWIRQVIIPGYNDNINYIESLAAYISKIKNVERVELLPYHTKGTMKYKELNIPYKLDNVSDMDIEKCSQLEIILKEKISNY